MPCGPPVARPGPARQRPGRPPRRASVGRASRRPRAKAVRRDPRRCRRCRRARGCCRATARDRCARGAVRSRGTPLRLRAPTSVPGCPRVPAPPAGRVREAPVRYARAADGPPGPGRPVRPIAGRRSAPRRWPCRCRKEWLGHSGAAAWDWPVRWRHRCTRASPPTACRRPLPPARIRGSPAHPRANRLARTAGVVAASRR